MQFTDLNVPTLTIAPNNILPVLKIISLSFQCLRAAGRLWQQIRDYHASAGSEEPPG
jgi:hypothetical protein